MSRFLEILNNIQKELEELKAEAEKMSDTSTTDIVIDESPVFQPGNPSSHDGKKPDFVDEQKKEWFLKEGEGLEHLKWRAKDGAKDDEPDFNK